MTVGNVFMFSLFMAYGNKNQKSCILLGTLVLSDYRLAIDN